MQVWDDRGDVNDVIRTKADATRLVADEAAYRGDNTMHMRLVGPIARPTLRKIMEILLRGLVNSYNIVQIHSVLLVPCCAHAYLADKPIILATDVDNEVLEEIADDVSVWDAATWQFVGLIGENAVAATLLDGMLRGQAPQDGWKADMLLREWSSRNMLARVTDSSAVSTWAELHEEWRAGRLNLVETRVHMPHDLPDLLVQRARGVMIYNIALYAETRIERAQGDLHFGYVIKACDEVLDGERTLESYGIDDETPVTLCEQQ